MTIFFENDRDIIVYALEKIIAFAKSNQYIILAQSVWWIFSVIGLQAGLVNYVDNLRTRSAIVSVPRDGLAMIQEPQHDNDFSHQDKILQECEEYL